MEPARVERLLAEHVDCAAEVVALLGPFTGGLEVDGPSRTAWRIADERVELLAGALTWLVRPFAIVGGGGAAAVPSCIREPRPVLSAQIG